MDAVGPKRKPAVKLKLQEHDWDPVKTFVETYFEQPDKSTKATYEVLLSEIKKVFPDFDISKSTFKKYLGTIEKWKEKAGLQIHSDPLSKDYRQQLHNIFLQVLIGLPLEEFKSIKFEELLRRAHEREPDLKINEKIKATLAYHF